MRKLKEFFGIKEKRKSMPRIKKEIVKVEKKEMITEKMIIDYAKTFLTGQLTDKELVQFQSIAVAFQLNPYKREIYCVPYETKYGRKLSILTGYEVYLKRAERLNMIDGWNCWTEGKISDNSLKAIIEINRKDWSNPFRHEVYLSEYKQNNTFWINKPITMIKKVCISQAFRLCFPDEFGGMPYTQDEMPNDMNGVKKEKKLNAKLEKKVEEIEIIDDGMQEKKEEVLDIARKKYKSLSSKQLKYFMELKNVKDYNETQYKLDMELLEGIEDDK